MKIDILGLQAFLSVADHGGIVQAAAVMNLSPTALSHRIRKLEDALGVELFVRTGRHLVLTQPGTAITPRVRRVLETCEGCIDELRSMAAPQDASVSLACLPTLAANWLPQVLQTFRRLAPTVRVRLHDRAAPEILDLVMSGTAHFGLSIASAVPSELDIQKLRRVPYRVMCHKNSPLARRSKVKLNQLAKEPLICLGHRDIGRLIMEEAFARRKQGFRPALEVNSGIAALRMVAQGLGIALLPRFAHDPSRDIEIASVPLEPERFHINLGIVTSRTHPVSDAASQLLRCVAKAVMTTQW